MERPLYRQACAAGPLGTTVQLPVTGYRGCDFNITSLGKDGAPGDTGDAADISNRQLARIVLYEVRAADAACQLKILHLAATDAVDARQQALRLRLTPVSVKPHFRRSSGGRGRFDLPLFAEELQMLLGAGLSLIDAIDGLAERQAGDTSHSVLMALAERLRNGERLSAAMGRQPEVFPALFVGIVRAAESTSNLPSSLSNGGTERRMAP